MDHERTSHRIAEKELKKALANLEEERGKQKQIVLMLVEERKRLALQYAEERKRSEDLAQVHMMYLVYFLLLICWLISWFILIYK